MLSCIVAELTAPAALVADAAAAAAAAGLIASPAQWSAGGAGWKQAWGAVTAVWASKWTERAWLSRKARGVEDSELYMAVLLQQVRFSVQMVVSIVLLVRD